MRVRLQILSPRMQDTEEADFGSQVFGISGHFNQSLRTGLE